ncbi:MmgE/PrpD family protein [Microvirga brassicacearum]|uniref:MmgE/PrpD family protein n=1 Tax=Microvirga brassicacearum TaxID=2580413 RepID=A0A5N3PCI1_9HYPH|nr:MmgE/PrpD family protein [Microvirga brassicacearum]KAB0267404.1 MmgE/PrpD family protein [Microvirga brassicacearum]
MADNVETTGVAAVARFVTSARPTDLPELIRQKVARHTLDTLACGVAGAASQEAQACLDLALTTEQSGSVAVWGTAHALAPRSAALINGIACHAFELDDTGGCDHSGAVVLPAALAAVALVDRPVSGSEFLLAVVLGYEVARRVLEACGGYEPHNQAGWHSTATCGTFGAASAAARILQLDAAEVAHALGHAASFSGGLWGFIHDGSQTKRIHAGRAAEGGLFAAMLARAGITGPSTVFEDRWGGFLSTFAPQSANPEALTVGLGGQWRLERVSLKPYASCRGTHSAIDALGELIDGNAVGLEQVERIDIRLSQFLFDMCGGRDISTLPFAQMSLPYALAARLVTGRADLAAYRAERRQDPALHAAMEKITLAVDPRIAATDEPYVRVMMRDGRSHETRVTAPLGSPANPISDELYFAKIRSLAGLSLDGVQTERLVTGVLQLWGDTDMRWLGEALSAKRSRPAVLN